MIVVDCSITIAWCMPDESNLNAQKALDYITEERGLVPFLWHMEVANTLLMAERRKRINHLHRETLLKLVHDLPLETAKEDANSVKSALLLAEKHKLTVYDSMYLHLALEEQIKLATLDQELAKAAKAHGILFS